MSTGIGTPHNVQPQVAQFNSTGTQHAATSSSELQGGVVVLSTNVNNPVEFNAGTLQKQATETASAEHAVRNSLENSGSRTTGQSRIENALSNVLTGLPPQRPQRDVQSLPLRSQTDVQSPPVRPQTSSPKLAQNSKTSPLVDLQPRIAEKKIRNLVNASEEFLYQYPKWKRIQFDILSITILKNETVEYFFIEDVFL